MKIKLNYDVYNISKRVKEIDKYYYVVYDTSKNKFEIHNSKQIGSTYCLTLPFKCLDERCLNYINKTKSENIEKILNEIDNLNNIKESADKTSALNNVCEAIERNLKGNNISI